MQSSCNQARDLELNSPLLGLDYSELRYNIYQALITLITHLPPAMTFQELLEFIDAQDAFFRSKGGEGTREIFARTIKLGEEYGELCDEVLASVGDQRKDKLNAPRELEGEFADVVITAFMLAKAMKVDMPHALAAKIKKIRTKYNRQLANLRRG